MGAGEETRKLVQDFLAPELREIKARLEALEAITKTRFDAVDARFDAVGETTKARFDGIEKTAKARFDAVDARFNAVEETTKARFNAVDARFDALEETTKARFDAQEKMASANHLAVMSALNSLTNYAALAERLTRLESERGQQAH